MSAQTVQIAPPRPPMGSRKRPADWSAALSHERTARAEAVGERLAAERQLDELQEQLAGVEAEREGLESQLTALGAEREAHAELERDLEDALEELWDMEEAESCTYFQVSVLEAAPVHFQLSHSILQF